MVKVLVTGGNGFIAAHIIEQLLSRGDDVVFTVRSQLSGDRVLESHPDQAASGKLQSAVVEDITRPGAMDKVLHHTLPDAFRGIHADVPVAQVLKANPDFTYVLHTASPFVQQWADAAKDMLEPAVEGTVQTLRSIAAHGSAVKRVVVLSSLVTLMGPPPADGSVQVFEESMWNPVTWDAAVADPRLTYTGSKTLAEKAAWDFMRSGQHSFDLVALNPPLVFGPVGKHLASLDKINTSNKRVLALAQGALRDAALPPTGVYLWVDARDVALAHLRALDRPAAGGKRFLLVAGHFSNKTLADAIARTHPEVRDKLPVDGKDDTPANVYQFNVAQAKEVLGLEFRGFDECVRDTVSSLL